VTRFLDGPAAGVVLTLTRSPRFLRVVQTPAGEWDALDQLADTPSAGEVVHAYERAGPASTYHLDYHDKQGRRRGLWGRSAGYRHVPAQPPAESLADTAAWRAWCWAAARTGVPAAEARQPLPAAVGPAEGGAS